MSPTLDELRKKFANKPKKSGKAALADQSKAASFATEGGTTAVGGVAAKFEDHAKTGRKASPDASKIELDVRSGLGVCVTPIEVDVFKRESKRKFEAIQTTHPGGDYTELPVITDFRLKFGKFNGQTVKDLFADVESKDYLRWVLKNEFPVLVKKLIILLFTLESGKLPDWVPEVLIISKETAKAPDIFSGDDGSDPDGEPSPIGSDFFDDDLPF